MDTSSFKRTTGFKWWLLVVFLCSWDGALAQTDEEEDEETIEVEPSTTVVPGTEAAANERIQVTGSRIKRMDVESSAPITVISREAIEQSGLISLGEVFRDSASLSPVGNFAGASGFVSQGSATLNLLGLGAGRTLVLLNGKRLPVSGGGGGLNAVNVDNIPTGMIERIEVLSGGASAIYGADAVGGVINIITKKQFQGTEISFTGILPHNPGGEEYEFSAFQGMNLTDDFNLSVAGGYRHRKPIDKRDRDLAYSSPERRFTATNPPPGQYSWRPANTTTNDAGNEVLDFGDWAPSANCPAGNQVATVPSEPNDVYCAGLREEVRSEIIPQKEEWYLSATMDYAISPLWNLSALLNYHRSENIFDQGKFLSTSSEPYQNRSTTLSKERAVELGVVGADVNAEFIQIYAPVQEIPSRRYTNTNETGVAALYLDGSIGVDWTVQGGLSYSKTEGRRKGENILNSTRVHEMLFNQDHPFGADPAFVSIDPNRDSSILFAAMDELNSKEINDSFSSDVFASRPVFMLPGGDFSLGIGAGFYTESFELQPDAKDRQFNPLNRPLYAGTFASQGSGSREITSVFAEFLAPVLESVDLEGALRFDHYSDFDSTLNFGFGIKADVLPYLSLRGRAASSYTAPTLSYLHQEGGGGYFVIRDEKWCQREIDRGRICEMSNPTRQVYVENPGNEDLEPETGVNYTAGFILEPMHGINLLVDYYWVNLKKTFQRDDLQAVADTWYEQNPNATEGGAVNENTVALDDEGVIASIGLPYRNLGRLEMRGMDTKLTAQQNFGDYRFAWETQYFRLFSFREQESPDEPLRQQLGYFGMPRWRLNNQLSTSRDRHTFILRSRTIGRQGQDPDTATPDSINSKVGPYTRYDLVYGAALTSAFNLQVGVNNLFDTLGGLEDGNSLRSENIVSTSLYSPVGRSYFARMTYRF
ncbi:MAG: TonB-dependent receptor plug domain-containing protein [Oligoflexus sp.]